MRIVRTLRAEEDLLDIWADIARDNQGAADRVLELLERRTVLLARHPMIGRDRPDIAPGLRYLPSGSYLILYRFKQDAVEIVRYVHGRRDMRDVI